MDFSKGWGSWALGTGRQNKTKKPKPGINNPRCIWGLNHIVWTGLLPPVCLGNFQKNRCWTDSPVCACTEAVPRLCDFVFIFTCTAVEDFVIISANIAGGEKSFKMSIVLLW